MSRYLLTATDPAQDTVTATYTDRSTAIRGAKRYLTRNPETSVTLVDTMTARVIWEQLREAVTAGPVEAPEPLADATSEAAEVSAAEPVARTPRAKTPCRQVRPFTIELFERGDEVLDIAAQVTTHPMRLQVVIVGGSDDHAIGEVLGIIEWKTGVNRWVPALAARDEMGKVTDFPRPDRRGRPVSGKTRAVAALFDLLGSSVTA